MSAHDLVGTPRMIWRELETELLTPPLLRDVVPSHDGGGAALVTALSRWGHYLPFADKACPLPG